MELFSHPTYLANQIDFPVDWDVTSLPMGFFYLFLTTNYLPLFEVYIISNEMQFSLLFESSFDQCPIMVLLFLFYSCIVVLCTIL